MIAHLEGLDVDMDGAEDCVWPISSFAISSASNIGFAEFPSFANFFSSLLDCLLRFSFIADVREDGTSALDRITFFVDEDLSPGEQDAEDELLLTE